MKQINQYLVVEELEVYSDQIKRWHCQESTTQQAYELLTISYDENTEHFIRRLLFGEVSWLIGIEIGGIQPVKEIGIDANTGCQFIVYEYDKDYQGLNQRRQEANVQTMIDVATGLQTLRRQNVETQLISPRCITVNSEGRGRLSLVGLFELFAQQELLEAHYLSPNAKKWLARTVAAEVDRPNFQDDFYSLVKSFEFVLKDLKKYTAASDVLSKGLDKTSILRFDNYRVLIDLLGTLPSTTAQNEERNAIKVVVNRKRMDSNSLRLLLKDLNGGVWLDMSKRRSNKGNLEGQFSTNTWNGKFVLNHDKSFFIPHCHQTPNDRLLNSSTAFYLTASFGEYPSRHNWIPFFTEKFEAKNQLDRLLRIQQRLVREWRVLPEKEREVIEAAAFKSDYDQRSMDEKGNICFHLKKDKNLKNIKWRKIDKKLVRINQQVIGRILHFNPVKFLLTIGNPRCTLSEIPKKGRLVQDIRQESSQFKKQIDACDQFEASNVVNPHLCTILANPTACLLPKQEPLSTLLEVSKTTVFNPLLAKDSTQFAAVLEAMNRKPLYLIQGPPGTGKTTVIVELIQQILHREKQAKILVTSQSNLAVDNVLERINAVSERLPESEGVSFMRLASEYTLRKEQISPEILPHTFERKLKKWAAETGAKAASNFDLLTGRKKEELIQTQKDWLAFLGNVALDGAKHGQESMLNDGRKEVDFLTAMLRDVSVIGATCIHIASGQYSHINFQFDYVIMDESSKASPPETLVPINMGRNIILIGDHQQLPPVVTKDQRVRKGIENVLDDNGLDFNKMFGTSLFETLIKAFEKDQEKQSYVKMLDVQYRMPKDVGKLVSTFFYGGKLKSPSANINEGHGLSFKKETSIVFISTSKEINPSDNGDKLMRQNTCNAAVIQKILRQLNERYATNLNRERPLTIGVIAGYRGQVNLLRKELNLTDYPNFVQIEKERDRGTKETSLIAIDTVDKFQGAERDIIIYDVVRSSANKQDVIGFLEDYRRINVAFSRVKRLLIVVGDSDYLRHRAILHPESKMKEFKLQQIAETLHEQGLIFYDLSEILD